MINGYECALVTKPLCDAVDPSPGLIKWKKIKAWASNEETQQLLRMLADRPLRQSRMPSIPAPPSIPVDSNVEGMAPTSYCDLLNTLHVSSQPVRQWWLWSVQEICSESAACTFSASPPPPFFFLLPF